MRKIFLTSIIFLIIGVLLLLIYYIFFPSFYIKGVYLLNPGQNKTLDIPYPSYIFEYKDNITKPLNITLQSATINKYYENNSIFYYFGNSFDGKAIVTNNYTMPVLFGYVVIDNTSFFFFLPVLFYIGIIMIALGLLILGTFYVVFRKSEEENKK